MQPSSLPHARDLPDSARAIFRMLAQGGPATRPQLGEGLDISKPTVSESIAHLRRRRLVELNGSSQGATGRSAAVYKVSPHAGHVIGVDVGSTHLRIRAHTLDGVTVFDKAVSTSRRQRHISPTTITAATRLVRETLERLDAPVRALTLAVPTSVSPVFREPGDAARVSTLIEQLRLTSDVSLEVENNVNCAAVAEHHYGAGVGHPTFAYLQIGVKIGLGIIHDGALFRGASHAAGEPARLPFPWSVDEVPETGKLEQHLGATSLMRRCRARWPADSAPPRDAADLFVLAGDGHPVARSVVDDHAADVGRLLAAVVSVLDPGLLVLGGGVGQNPLLVPGARRVVRKLAWSTDVVSTLLGDEATVVGAATLATQRALDEVSGDAAARRQSFSARRNELSLAAGSPDGGGLR